MPRILQSFRTAVSSPVPVAKYPASSYSRHDSAMIVPMSFPLSSSNGEIASHGSSRRESPSQRCVWIPWRRFSAVSLRRLLSAVIGISKSVSVFIFVPNQSPEPTGVGACCLFASGFINSYATGRPWLSFFVRLQYAHSRYISF